MGTALVPSTQTPPEALVLSLGVWLGAVVVAYKYVIPKSTPGSVKALALWGASNIGGRLGALTTFALGMTDGM